MKKTSVYLTADEVEGLRRASLATGKSQAELIREGVRHVISSDGYGPRTFHSLGKGRGSGSPYVSWDPDDLYKHVMGRP